MTGQAFINSVMYSVGKVQTLTTDSNFRTICLDWLNTTIKDFASRGASWSWLQKTATFSTVASQYTYDLPTDIDTTRIFSLKQKTSPSVLTYINQRRMDELEPKPTSSSGNPLLYTVYGAYLRLWPVPDSAITMYLRYMKKVTAFTDSASSTSDIPDKHDEAILWGVKRHAFMYESGWGDPMIASQLYEAGIQRALADEANIINAQDVTESHAFGEKVLISPYHFDATSVGS